MPSSKTRPHCLPKSVDSYICDQLFWELRNFDIQIVHDVVHHAFSLFADCRVSLERVGFESVSSRSKPVHINMSVFLCYLYVVYLQFFIKLFAKLSMQMRWEISQSIFNCLLFLGLG